MSADPLEAAGPHVGKKLTNVLGARAAAVAKEVLIELGLARVETPEDRMRFGTAMVAKGGFLAVIGRSIQTQATLHGAVRQLDEVLAHARRTHSD